MVDGITLKNILCAPGAFCSHTLLLELRVFVTKDCLNSIHELQSSV